MLITIHSSFVTNICYQFVKIYLHKYNNIFLVIFLLYVKFSSLKNVSKYKSLLA